MKTNIEFRILESYAKEFLPPEIGENITDLVRKVSVQIDSDLYKEIEKAYKIIKARDNKHLFFGWKVRRDYSNLELSSAKLLLLKLTKTFEPSGQECGTIYNFQNTCEFCGFGIQQISELILDINKIPKKTNIARTISNEIVINQDLADLLDDNNCIGYKLGMVSQQSTSENIFVKKQKHSWYQLIVTSSVTVNSATKTGEDPFDEDKDNVFRCKYGHTIGLDILSELSINSNSWDGSDLVATKQLFGVNRGLLRTYPLILVSQRLYSLLNNAGFKGYKVEVVNLIS